MSQYKRIISILTVILLILVLFSGCGQRSRKEKSGETTLLLDQWHGILQIHEQTVRDLLWTYDSIDGFLQDSQWESLLKAQAAASTALRDLQSIAAPECTLTAEQISALLHDGIEADVVTTEYETMPETLTAKQDTMTLVNHYLQNDMFLTPSVETFSAWLDSSRKITEMESRYLWLSTNYLLLQTNAPELWEQWIGEFPALGSFATVWEESSSVLMETTDKLLDTMADELVNYGTYMGTNEYTLHLVEDAVNTGDLSALAREIHTISGVPGYFITPGWLPAVLPYYLFTDPETEEKVLIDPGAEITQAPSVCYISCAGVSLDDVEGYAAHLENNGLAPYVKWDEQTQVWQMLVSVGDSQMLMEWSKEETILYFTDPVGCLIPELYFAAMLTE